MTKNRCCAPVARMPGSRGVAAPGVAARLAEPGGAAQWGKKSVNIQWHEYQGIHQRGFPPWREVEFFDTPLDSVSSYLHNLNTHRSYRELRETGEPVTGLALATGLSRYSERGDAYVKEVRSLIRSNDLEQAVAAEPAPSA